MERINNNSENRGIPENNSSKPTGGRKERGEFNDENTAQDFPGYPHYPAREDIMNNEKRVDADVENLPNKLNSSSIDQRFIAGQHRKNAENAMTPQPGLGNDDLDIHMGTEADVTEDDLAVLNSTDAEIGTPQNVSNEDLNTGLDVPGSELDDESEEIGEEDEENNYYSLGGDRHEAQEEDPYSGPVRD